jgi:Predicted metalloendopeptidase
MRSSIPTTCRFSSPYLHTIGVPAFFRFNAQTDLRDATQSIANVDQGGLSLPDRDYYLKTDARSEEIRGKFAAHVERTFLLAGQSAENAARASRSVMSVENRLAQAGTRSREAARSGADSASDDVGELQRISPAFDWKRYGEASEAPKFQALNVSVPDTSRRSAS